MIQKHKNNVLTRKNQKDILIDYFFRKNDQAMPIVIFCHGYKGFKDWGASDLIAEAFANAGFFFVKFNFSHNGGTLKEPMDFPDLEAFGENNYTKELDDLQFVIDYVTNNSFQFSAAANSNQISIIGHSRGGGIVTIKAEEEPKVTNVISWAGVSDFASRLPQGKVLENWKLTNVMYVLNGRTKQNMPHYYQFFEDFKANEKRLDIQRATKNLKIPHLIVHGTSDFAVPTEDAENIHQWNPKSKLEFIENADHVFGAQHPWNKLQLPVHLEEVVNSTIDFIKNA